MLDGPDRDLRATLRAQPAQDVLQVISDRAGGSTSRWAIWSFPGLVLVGAGIGLILAGC